MPLPLKFSDEQAAVNHSKRCPNCEASLGFYLWRLQLFREDGTKIDRKLHLFRFLDHLHTVYAIATGSLLAGCPECSYRWPVLQKPQTRLRTPAWHLIETRRSEEPIGEEERRIDNSQSTISLSRRFSLSKEWSKTYVVEAEKVEKRGGVRLEVSGVGSLHVDSEKAIRTFYSVSEEEKHVYTEDVTLEIPPRTKLRVVFRWKRIWQHGIIRILDQAGRESSVPFQIVVGLSFDQTQLDEPT